MKTLISAAALAAALVAAPAAAQTAEDFSGLYGGVQGVYHDVQDIEFDDATTQSRSVGIDGIGIGGYVGFNAPLGQSLVFGVEGNYSFGVDGEIESEYGVSAHIGAPVGAGLLFVRAGYQEINLDLGKVADAIGIPGVDEDDLGDVDDTAGGWLVGVGGEFAAGPNTAFRIAVDTIEFDTLRPTVGFTFRFR